MRLVVEKEIDYGAAQALLDAAIGLCQCNHTLVVDAIPIVDAALGSRRVMSREEAAKVVFDAYFQYRRENYVTDTQDEFDAFRFAVDALLEEGV